MRAITLLCFFSWLFSLFLCAGNPISFIDSGQNLGNSSSSYVILADLDNNGTLDAFVVNWNIDSCKVWLNNGSGVFSDSGQNIGNPCFNAALGDLDNNGTTDAFIAYLDQPNEVWFNDGTGTFSDSGQRLGDLYTYQVVLGKLDDNNSLDALVINYAEYSNKLWFNNGNGFFSDSGQDLGTSGSLGAALGDADGDGDLDAFIANNNGPNKVWINQTAATNQPPVAHAGADQSCVVNEILQLDGSSSSDPDEDPLTYYWQIIEQPDGSEAQLSDPTLVNPTLQPDVPGEYVITLVVNDGLLNSAPDTVIIAAQSIEAAVQEKLQDASTTISQLPTDAFANKNRGNTMVKKIDEVIDKVDQGNTTDAKNKLQNDVLKKTDGCPTTGSADKNDWIIDCQAQGQVYPKVKKAVDLLSQLQ